MAGDMSVEAESDDEHYLPEDEDGPINDDDNISPAVRALMAKYVSSL
jgi:hypothetical protein